jgi:hypothetical protein
VEDLNDRDHRERIVNAYLEAYAGRPLYDATRVTTGTLRARCVGTSDRERRDPPRSAGALLRHVEAELLEIDAWGNLPGVEATPAGETEGIRRIDARSAQKVNDLLRRAAAEEAAEDHAGAAGSRGYAAGLLDGASYRAAVADMQRSPSPAHLPACNRRGECAAECPVFRAAVASRKAHNADPTARHGMAMPIAPSVRAEPLPTETAPQVAPGVDTRWGFPPRITARVMVEGVEFSAVLDGVAVTFSRSGEKCGEGRWEEQRPGRLTGGASFGVRDGTGVWTALEAALRSAIGEPGARST